MSRLQTTLNLCKEKGEKALGLFITNGFPSPDAVLPILQTLDANAVDFIELGMPFSDPLAEGLPIQRSSAQALSHGTKMSDAFRVVRDFRKTSQTPILLMGYINPILKYGMSNFCHDAASSGVDGVIVPDLPPQEATLFKSLTSQHNLNLINLIAPNTADARVSFIDRETTGFVYAVSVTGLTGSSIATDSVQQYLQRVRNLVTHNPLLVGFGIKTYDDAQTLSATVDGFIVGSALICLIEDLWADSSLPVSEKLAQIGRFVQHLKTGATFSTIPA